MGFNFTRSNLDRIREDYHMYIMTIDKIDLLTLPSVILFLSNGNIISLMVYLAPAPTFYGIVKNKSTEEFQSIPYVVALFSSTTWIYYATLKTDATLLITINVVGCVIETLYIAIYVVYAPKKIKIQTIKLVVSLNLVGFWFIALSSHYLTEGPTRAKMLGWICMVTSVSVYAAPLSIMKKVIRTKSVEFMPFGLSFFLALSAVMWFFYGLFQKDFYVALPNAIGFVLVVIQMILYLVFKNHEKKNTNLEQKLPTSSSALEKHSVYYAPKNGVNNYTNSKETITLECTQEENIEARTEEPPMICTRQPIDDLIKDVMKDDIILKASTDCAYMVQPIIDDIENHNKIKNMEAPNQVYLIEAVA